MALFKTVPNFNELTDLNIPFKAVLWDMDGTIMNTERLHAIATLNLLNKQDSTHSFTPESLEDFGRGEIDKVILKKLQDKNLLINFEASEFIKEKNQEILQILSNTSSKNIFRPKIKALMQELKERGIPQAVVTSSEKEITHPLLEFLELDFFEFIITRPDTTENKPHPAPYLLASSKLGVEANNIMVFEDSEVGMAAVKAANMNLLQALWY